MKQYTYDELVNLLEDKLSNCGKHIEPKIRLLNGFINSVPENGKMYTIKLADPETMVKVREYMIKRRKDLRIEIKKQ